MYFPIFISDKNKQESGWYIAKKINENKHEILKIFGRFDSREAAYFFIDVLIRAKEKSSIEDDYSY